MLHVVLVAPCIPQNTGNIGRLCAFSACRLHLVHPLGFELSDRSLRRAGMDYWRDLDVHEHASWPAFCASPLGPRRRWLMTTRASQPLWRTRFADGDGLIFGNETAGAPPEVHADVGEASCLHVPRFAPALRSLNLATCVGICVYEGLRQLEAPHDSVRAM